MKPILIITSKSDIHCDFVTKQIRNLGGDIIRLNSDNLETNLSFTITDNENFLSMECFIQDSKVSFDRNSVNVIWYRKPFPVKVKMEVHNDEITDYVNAEWNRFVSTFYDLFKDKIWVNSIWNIRRANFKLSNLETAKSLGFMTPKTIVTNRIESAEAFVSSCNRKVIAKPFAFSGFQTKDKQAYSPFANLISERDFQQFKNSVIHCPTFLQEYIEKHLELRVTLVGDSIFAASIDSQSNADSKFDFRAHSVYELKHEIYKLPSRIEQQLIQFNKYFGLSFSTFDIILTPQGEYVFLECNPNGQWYWIEELTGLPISAAMAELLISMNK